MKTVNVMLLALLFFCMFFSSFGTNVVEASGSIYIRTDGSIEPPTAPILRSGDLYTLTGNITSDANGIVIERDNITIDGDRYTIQGSGSECGFYLYGNRSINNVTIINTNIRGFAWGICIISSSDCTILRNNITNNEGGLYLGSGGGGNNIIIDNIIEANTRWGIMLSGSSNNVIYHNHFIHNGLQVETDPLPNGWDGGYPSGGNYWSDYAGIDEKNGANQNQIGSDGIGDMPYIIAENNRDRYPLMSSWTPLEHELFTSTTAPLYLRLGSSLSLTATVTNDGLNDEVDVELVLLMNSTIVNSVTIPLLKAGDTYTLSHAWAPAVEGTYNVTVYAHPVPAESYIANNQVSRFPIVAETLRVPEHFSTIQAGVDAANPGDDIYVSAGTYYEKVKVNKAISLFGEDPTTTIVDGNGRFVRVVEIVANNVAVQNFTIRNSNQNADWWSNNLVCISQSNDTLIQNNIITTGTGWSAGVVVINSSRNAISGNTVTTNSNYGVELWCSPNNVISGNTLINNAWGIDLVGDSSYNTLTGNNITNNRDGISCIGSFNTIWGNVVTNNGYNGISLYGSSHTVCENIIGGGERGLVLYDYSHNISKNMISTCKYDGILVYCHNSSIYANNLADNGQAGITIEISSSYNKFHHNNFINNTQSVLTLAVLGKPPMPNAWDDGYPSGGNYWSDYSATDANHDGIGDAPYTINANNLDRYPLMTQYIIPEFSSFLILLLFFIATLLTVIDSRRKTNAIGVTYRSIRLVVESPE